MADLEPGHFLREGIAVSPWEALAYDQIATAAEQGQPCPLNLDLEMVIGCNSSSVPSTVVARLEAKGLIRVLRYQKFRKVQVVATGDWTARDPRQQSERAHVPRPSRSPQPTERKLYKAGRL